MAVFLMVLLGIGKVLLVILIILAILVALLLFFPFCYSGTFTKHGDEIKADGRIWWLFHAVHATGFFHRTDGKNKKGGEVRIFGIPLIRLIRKHREKTGEPSGSQAASSAVRAGDNGRTESGEVGDNGRTENGEAGDNGRIENGETADNSRQDPGTGREQQSRMPSGRNADGSAKKKPVVEPGRWKYMPDASAEKTDMRPGVYHRKNPSPAEKLYARLAALIGKIKKKIGQAVKKLKEIGEWLRYFGTDDFSRVKELLIRQGGGILRHILPRRITGYVEFGAEDPSDTGKILGLVAALYPVMPEGLEIQPDFTEKKLEADVKAAGHFFLIVVLVRGLKIWFNRDFKALRKRISRAKNTGTASDSTSEETKKEKGAKRIFRRSRKDAGQAA